MDEQLEQLTMVLRRINSIHLSHLWSFYRPYFRGDIACMTFIYNVFRNENLKENAHSMEELKANDRLLIPRRMLNCVERLVSAAKDMEQIRRGKDIFKIVYLVTCVETLQKLKGRNDLDKKEMLFDFFENYTSACNKQYICKHFSRIGDEINGTEDTFWQFISMLNECRNCATHEGEYWDLCFNNGDSQTPLLIVSVAQLHGNAKKEQYGFVTTLSYKTFEYIFVQNCINFIMQYIQSQGKPQMPIPKRT